MTWTDLENSILIRTSQTKEVKSCLILLYVGHKTEGNKHANKHSQTQTTARQLPERKCTYGGVRE